MAELPRRSAGPAQVRAYLTYALIHKHDIPSESAQATANLWRFGGAGDLRKGSKKDFVRIFGEVGPFLHASVDEDKYAEWRASTAGIVNYWALIVACVVALFFLARAFHLSAPLWKNLLRAYLVLGPTLLICGCRELQVRNGSLQNWVVGTSILLNVFAPIAITGFYVSESAKKH